MAIDPIGITAIRVGQLAEAPINLSDNFAHEVGTDLKRATIQDLVDIVSDAVGVGSGVGYYPLSVVDGQQLPALPLDPSFFLCGKGTFLNINGFPDIVCVEELNAVMTATDHWEIAVEIPIEVDSASIGIAQTVNQGVTDSAPSQDAVFNALHTYLNTVGSAHYSDLATQTTPQAIASGVDEKILNDGEGAYTNETNLPYGVSTLYDATNSQIDLSQLSIGDLVTFRMDVLFDTSGSDQVFKFYLKLGIGSASEFTLHVAQGQVKLNSVFRITEHISFDIGSADIRDYPAELWIATDGNADVVVNGYFIEALRKNINIVDLVAGVGLNEVMQNGNFTEENLQFNAGAGMQFYDGVYTSHINTENLTANRGIDFPNKSGVVALLSDITGGSETTTTMGALINSAGAATPNDSDLIATAESGGLLKKITWTNAKAFLKTYYDTIYTTTSAVATQITTALSGYLTSATAATTYEPIKGSDDNFVTDAEKVVIGNTSGANSGNETDATIATINHAATAKTVLVDADEVTGQDSADTFALIRTVWSDVWTYIKSKADTFYQATLVSGTNIKTINSTSILGSGDIVITGGAGDMTTTTDQTVSGIKTFLAGKLGFRNVANTFTSFFTNANTAARTYTFQDKSYTVADNADLAGKMANPTGGIASYLPKFLTATTIGLSRIWDTGTFLGIGTSVAPTKDITLGNQANRTIGIEESNSSIAGKNLKVSAGRTINYAPNANFNTLNQLPLAWGGMAVASNNDVYSCINGVDIYKQSLGVGDFASLSQGTKNWAYMATHPNGNIYATSYANPGAVFMQTGGTGNFNNLSQTVRNWSAIGIAPNGNVYASSYNNDDVYMQTGGTGNFVALGQTNRIWQAFGATPNGNVYACVEGGDIYMQTNGTGNFVALGQTSRIWRSVCGAPNGNVYASVANGDIYMQTGGTGNFVALGQTSRNWYQLASASNGNIYAAANGAGIYMQQNDALGVANLDGGTFIVAAGTGKGTGKSRYEVWTGQKLASGTDMQVETLREYVDENGYHVYVSIPSYANDAAADADTNLPSGASYKLTGNRTIFHKP